jgi:hypothetical protein
VEAGRGPKRSTDWGACLLLSGAGWLSTDILGVLAGAAGSSQFTVLSYKLSPTAFAPPPPHSRENGKPMEEASYILGMPECLLGPTIVKILAGLRSCDSTYRMP